MNAHRCDVCQQDAHLACSHCLQAVYCGEACQAAHFTEHSEICTHVDELAHDEVMDEVAGHLEDADSDADDEMMQTGYQIIDAQDSHAGRVWIGEMLRSDLIGITARNAENKAAKARAGKGILNKARNVLYNVKASSRRKAAADRRQKRMSKRKSRK